MVAMVIGLIGVAVIFQVFATFEGQRRTTTGGSDAQISGNIALFSIEREVRLGGYGFANASLLNCTVQAYDSQRTSPGTFTFSFVPVEITHNAAGDTLSVLYGNAPLMVSGREFTAPSASSANYKMNPRSGYVINDLVIAAGTGAVNACVMAQITDIPGTPGQTDVLQHNPGQGRYNKPGGLDGPTAGTLYNIGGLPKKLSFSIQGGNRLTAQDDIQYTDADADGVQDRLDVADGIVNLQAQFGIDADNNGIVSDAEFTDTAPANAAAWALLRAVRVAVLARSGQFEKTQVTPAAPAWSGGTFTMTNLDGSAGTGSPANAADNWRNYRYRVYETVVPLRNMIWR